MWKIYIVLFLSRDWYTHYNGHVVVKARTEREAVCKAANALDFIVTDEKIDNWLRYVHPKSQGEAMYAEVEELK